MLPLEAGYMGAVQHLNAMKYQLANTGGSIYGLFFKPNNEPDEAYTHIKFRALDCLGLLLGICSHGLNPWAQNSCLSLTGDMMQYGLHDIVTTLTGKFIGMQSRLLYVQVKFFLDAFAGA